MFIWQNCHIGDLKKTFGMKETKITSKGKNRSKFTSKMFHVTVQKAKMQKLRFTDIFKTKFKLLPNCVHLLIFAPL